MRVAPLGPAASAPPTSVVSRRLAGQQLSKHRFTRPQHVVAWFGALQAQDEAAARWAVGVRLPEGVEEQDVLGALADGSILRTHLFRGTWQLVTPVDLRWMLALVGPRLLSRNERRHRELGLDAPTLRRTRNALGRALGKGEQLTRDELAKALEAAGISTRGQRLPYLLQYAELEGLVCSGAPRGRKPTWAWLDLRVPPVRSAPHREEALALLARRYFRSRGPATLEDFGWWSGLTAAEARGALESIRTTLALGRSAGRQSWTDPAAPRAKRPRGALLLPAFDEYLLSYRNRDDVLAPEHVRRINPEGGMLSPCVVSEGRVVGTWRRTLSRGRVEVAVEPFAEGEWSNGDEELASAARRYGDFLGLNAELAFSARRRSRR